MNKLNLYGPSTLAAFTEAVSRSLSLLKTKGNIVQIHGSPSSYSEDVALLQRSRDFGGKSVYLIHRPDECLLHEGLRHELEKLQDALFIHLGDLCLYHPFWKTKITTVIPHPFTNMELPQGDSFIVGSFTSWGEMRNLEHYLNLIEELRGKGPFRFMIGGHGIDTSSLPKDVEIAQDFFVPHFNVQLYHLNGKKRRGESSGSLHRGVTVPVIFEANGAERLEELRVVKIAANDDLSHIDYRRAAEEMLAMDVRTCLEHNLNSARRNTTDHFAKRIGDLFAKIQD